MKKLILLTIMLGTLPLTMMAQDDDMYFVPTKKSVDKDRARYGLPGGTYYPGCDRSVDEYNRRAGHFHSVVPPDSTASDIIDFDGQLGVYPDSTQQDFAATREMSRWDGYEPGAAYWDGYNDGRRDGAWHSPWFYNSYYPWYTGWYDPWYMDRWYYDPWYYGYYGWRDPWYYGYYGYGYYHPWYYGGWYGGYVIYNGPTGNTGTLARNGIYSRSATSGRVTGYTSSSRFDGARNRAYSGNSGRTTYGNSTRSGTRSSTSTTPSRSTYNNSSYNRSVTTSGSSNSIGGYSSGGSRSGGFSNGGGSRTGGGGGRSGGGRR